LFKKNDWELIPAARPTHIYKDKIRLFGQYGRASWISMNTFSIDPKTVCVEAHETAYMEQLDKLGLALRLFPFLMRRLFLLVGLYIVQRLMYIEKGAVRIISPIRLQVIKTNIL